MPVSCQRGFQGPCTGVVVVVVGWTCIGSNSVEAGQAVLVCSRCLRHPHHVTNILLLSLPPLSPLFLLLLLCHPSGVPHSSTKPYVRAKGRKFEKARGRRKSRGYKA